MNNRAYIVCEGHAWDCMIKALNNKDTLHIEHYIIRTLSIHSVSLCSALLLYNIMQTWALIRSILTRIAPSSLVYAGLYAGLDTTSTPGQAIATAVPLCAGFRVGQDTRWHAGGRKGGEGERAPHVL